MPAPHLRCALATCLCGSTFDTHEHLKQHIVAKGHQLGCSVQGCNLLARDATILLSSSRHSGHDAVAQQAPALLRYESDAAIDTVAPNVCCICSSTCRNADGVVAHKRDSHPCCPSCHQLFARTAELEGHQRATDHCFCHEHSIAFSSPQAFRIHERAEPHVTGFECIDCGRHFGTEGALDHHLASCQARDPDRIAEQDSPTATAEARLAEVEEANLRCEACDRTFPNLHAQRQHKNSVKHKPLSEIRCILSTSCKQIFTSPSAYILHLESGKCKSGMSRHRLNCLVHASDAQNHITYRDNTRRLAPTGSQNTASLLAMLGRLSISSTSSCIPTPSQSDAASTTSSSGGARIFTPPPSDIASGASVATVKGLDQPIPRDSDTTCVVEVEDGAFQTTERRDGATPAFDNADVETIASESIGGAILTPSATNASAGGVILTSGASAAGDWTSMSVCPEAEWQSMHFDVGKQKWICNNCSAEFQKKKQIIQHLNSPVHESKLYHCKGITAAIGVPGLRKKAVKQFKTLSGFAQHVEAGSCTGRKEVLDTVAGIFEDKIRGATGKELRLMRR